MDAVLNLLHDHPVLLLAVLLALGAAVGHLAVAGVRIGPAAVLFAAIGLSAFAVSNGVTLEVPESVGTLGLVLFTYTIGVISGPTFFASLRSGWRTMLAVVGVFVVTGVVAVGVGGALGLRLPVIAGTFAGALTNTPALAAASERAADPSAGPTIGYSIAYLGGVVIMLLATAGVLRRREQEPTAAPLEHLTVRVDHADGATVAEFAARHGGEVTISRLKHGHADSPTVLPEDDEVIGHHDLVTLVGPGERIRSVAAELGHISSHNIVDDRHDLDFRRVTLSNKTLAGRTIGSLDLDERFGAAVSRVRRGDLDLVAQDDFVLQMGDRMRVVAPKKRLGALSAHLGDSDRGMSDINVGGLALGLAVGFALGLVHVPLPGGGDFAIGAAAGTLLVGLVFGRVGRLGPVITSMSHGAAQSLSALGMVLFLAYAGVRAGQRFVDAIQSDEGWRIAVLGVVLTSLAAGLLVLVARAGGRSAAEGAGVMAGAQTQPAILAFAQERTGYDMRVGIGYALVYPAAMIAKIVVAQVLAGLS